MYFYMSRYTLRQCSMGGVLHVQPLMIFGQIEEPCWTLNQTIFLKNALHNFTTEDTIIKKDATLVYLHLTTSKINTKRLLDFQKIW